MVTPWQIFFGRGLALGCACIVAGFIVLYHKKRDTRPLPFSEILVFLNRVYLGGLLKLIDPLEEAYLRESHSRDEFAHLQAIRIAEVREHFRKMVSNAVALQGFGYRHLRGDDDTKRWLAHRLINLAVPVKMFGRAGIVFLFPWRRLRILRRLLISFKLAGLKELVQETVEAYVDLKEAALMLAKYSEEGIERRVASRL